MRKLIDYIVSMKYIPEILKMLRKDKNGIYYVNMQIYGDAGFTFLDEYEFKLLQTAIRAITKQDELTLDYTYSFEGINEEDIIATEGDYQHVVWNEKKQEYV